MMRGKRSWSSHDRYYKSSHQLHSLENDYPSKKRHSKIRDPDEEILRTQMGTTREGSEESIIKKDYATKGLRPKNSIQRTDQVVIEYENRHDQVQGTSW